mgnify:CR=1 FL=1
METVRTPESRIVFGGRVQAPRRSRFRPADSYRETSAIARRMWLPWQLADREAYILEQCRGKDVLHVGCAAAMRWAESPNGAWLHGKIASAADRVVGIDSDAQAVSLLREKYGIDNVEVGHAAELDRVEGGPFDLVLADDVIERLPNPGAMLESARAALRPGGRVLLTASNAFCARRFFGLFANFEAVSCEQTAYYSHSTLKRLAELCGYRVVDQLAYCQPDRRRRISWLVERAFSVFAPNTGEGLICLLQTD